MIKIGTTNIEDSPIGSSIISKIYIGTNEYWSRSNIQYCTVSGLGSENPNDVTFTKSSGFDALFPFEQVTLNGNIFIKIPTFYRKVNTVVDNQITSYTIANSQIDSTYHPYPCFGSGQYIRPYVLIGKYYSKNASVPNSVPNGSNAIAYGATAINNCASLGTGYYAYTWMENKLWVDLVTCRTESVDSTNLTSDPTGIYFEFENSWVLGIWINRNSQKYTFNYTGGDRDSYSTAYSFDSSAVGNSGNTIKKLGYDQDHEFVNYPSEVVLETEYNNYYPDCSYISSESAYPLTSIGCIRLFSGDGGRGMYNSWFYTTSEAGGWGIRVAFRLCYKPPV